AEKAARRGLAETARDSLQRTVRQAAALAHGDTDFLDRLAARSPRQLKAARYLAGPPKPAAPRTSGGARPAPRCSRPSHATPTLTCSSPSSSSAVSWSSQLPVTGA
ncbi:hypothetical protein, partial [Streptomyces sp. NPDC054952]